MVYTLYCHLKITAEICGGKGQMPNVERHSKIFAVYLFDHIQNFCVILYFNILDAELMPNSAA